MGKMKVLVVLYLLVQCTLPVISGKISTDATKDEGKVLSKSNSLRDSISNTNVKGHGGEDEIVENWKLDPSQATPPKLFTAYKETYITKAAAKKFLQKIRSLKKPYTDKEYDDLLQEIMLEPKPTSKYSIYDKKYFDYLPSDQQEVKLDQEPTQQPHHRHHVRHHKERSKRHTTDTEEEKKVAKRHSGAAWSRHFLEHERRHFEHLRQEEEERNRRFSQQFQPVVYSNDIYAVPVSADPTNPWNNPFYRPRLNNYYLPPDPMQFVVHPDHTFIGYPIPGVIYNVPYPPQNPPVSQTTKAPPTATPKPTETTPEEPPVVPDGTMTRFGEDEDRPVWDVVEKPSRLIPERPRQPQSTTKRPSPPVIRDNDDYYDDLTASNRVPQANQGVRSTTRRPAPPLIHNSDDYDDMTSNSGSPQRPPSQTNSNQLALFN